jgi:hypothetical protein
MGARGTLAPRTKKKKERRIYPFVRFRGKADIDDRVAWTSSVANDPKRTSAERAGLAGM